MIRFILRYGLMGVILIAFATDTHANYGEKEKKSRESKKFTRNIKKAERYFNYFSFTKSISYYKKALEENPDDANTKLQIAESYRMLNDPINAEQWYAYVIDDPSVIKPQHKLRYAEVLTTNGKYDEAKKWYSVADTEVANDGRAHERLLGLENLDNFYQDSLSYFVQISNINSPEYDFSPTYYKEGIVFVSSRGEKKFLTPVYKWDETLFLDLFYSKSGPDGVNLEPQIMSNRINTKFHEGPAVFYENDTKVIFTRNNFNKGKAKTSGDGINKLKLFFSERKDGTGKWCTPVPFVFNSDEYSVGHPTLSSDGKTLYFASDMPGSLGKTDIWKSEYINNAWTTPENLGEEINTTGDEMFPFIKENKEIYFASNGHSGIGGLDLFRANIQDDVNEVLNLGYPVNSKKDDFGLIMKDKEGYFSSNREDGKGSDDIYHFWLNELNIEVQIIDALTREILHGDITVTDDARGSEEVVTTSVMNGVHFSGIKGRDYSLLGMVEGYVQNTIDFSTLEIPISDEFYIVQIPLVKEASLKGEILLVKNYGMDDQVFKLMDEKIEEFEGTFDELKSAFKDENREVENVYEIQNVYYDFDKHDIRLDAADDLDKLTQILDKYSELKVTLMAHTDSRGSHKYNEALAKRRVNSATDYLLEHKVGVDRIISQQSYGETKLINECGDNENCSEVAHQLNRRTNIFLSIDRGEGLASLN